MKAIPILLCLFLATSAHAQGVKRHLRPSRKAVALFALEFGSMAFDFTESKYAFQRGAHESDPIFGARQPSQARLYLIDVPIESATMLIATKLSQSKHFERKIWWLIPLYQTQVHIRDGFKGIRTCTANNPCK
jgi:hypothetical protein